MYCSPAYQKPGSCFKREQLVELADAWNESHPESPITAISKKSKDSLWKEINSRMSNICGGDGKEWCWADRLAPLNRNVAKALRPRKPVAWEDNPYEWLTNIDIEAVMNQYTDSHYQFIGVFPIDFQTAKTAFGQCLYGSMCNIQIKSLRAPYIGTILNLDRHDEGGSHWTSLFMAIDPKSPVYGAYYYDSVAIAPPKEVIAFVKSLNRQYKAIGQRQMRLLWNKKRHQYANSECGVFSMAFQIRWIRMLRDSPETANFANVIKIDIRDEDIHKLRDVLFRPRAA